jgi:hypothetical protein
LQQSKDISIDWFALLTWVPRKFTLTLHSKPNRAITYTRNYHRVTDTNAHRHNRNRYGYSLGLLKEKKEPRKLMQIALQHGLKKGHPKKEMLLEVKNLWVWTEPIHKNQTKKHRQ